ncbi:hypothetical protein EDB86DRAFT_629120 [Lactarius hatsudake]|nr:hypothetical protein EDB86DRAFT_629120 [Lactarius hatsudake]
MARDSQLDNVTLNHPCGFSTDAKKAYPSNEVRTRLSSLRTIRLTPVWPRIQKDPGARLPNLKVSIIPSILPVNDLAIDPFRPVFAASPVPKMLRWRLRPDSRRLRSFRRHARRPIRCVGVGTNHGRKDKGASVATLRLVSLPLYFSCLMRTTRLGAAANRSRRTCAGARWRASDPGGFAQPWYVPFVSKPPSSWIDLVLRENAYT